MDRCETFEPEGSKDAAIGKKENTLKRYFLFYFHELKNPAKSWIFELRGDN